MEVEKRGMQRTYFLKTSTQTLANVLQYTPGVEKIDNLSISCRENEVAIDKAIKPSPKVIKLKFFTLTRIF